MGSYFDRVEQAMAEAAQRRARPPWYRRMLAFRGARTAVVVFAALVVATPAVGAASGWFSFGKPNIPPPAKRGYGFGLEKPGSSRLLPIRVADPDGGPPWGLRIVRTGRGDTCLQFGRVEDGQIGSLGIDGAWDNDHLFHALSVKDDLADQCGSTDAVGHGYVNRGFLGTQASANSVDRGQGTGPGCQAPQYLGLAGLHKRPSMSTAGSTPGSCSASTGRVIFLGLLGPDAVSVTYRKPGGGLATQKTSGGVGAYLLVFPYNKATCYEYSHSARASQSCDSISDDGVSPSVPGAITKITYRDGHSCSLIPSAKLDAAYQRFAQQVIAKLGRPPRDKGRSKWLAAYRPLYERFLAREHLTEADAQNALGPAPSCPAVGWVPSKQPKVTAADVATPITVHKLAAGGYSCPNKLHLPQGCSGVSAVPTNSVPIEWSFKAREAVTSSGSWYEWSISGAGQGANCGGSSFATSNNVRKGQTLRYSTFLPSHCHGKYTIAVGFMPAASAGQAQSDAAEVPGQDGSVIVGRANFSIP